MAFSAAAYLEHLTREDLALLSRAGGVAPDELAGAPTRIERLLRDSAVYDLVFQPADEGPALMLPASPFLTFAVAIHHVSEDLSQASFVHERTGPRARLPVFDVGDLRAFVEDPARRFFLIELLASYTHVSSGAMWFRDGRRWRRRRFSELDPVRMASLLDVVDESQRPGIYRRLGDLALFLSGVFPNHAAEHVLQPVATDRLLRAAGVQSRPDADGIDLLEALGARWYRLASRSAGPVLAGTMRVVDDVAQRFRAARRILNTVTDRCLFPFRDGWFQAPR